MPGESTETWFTRDGHLTELTIARVLAGELVGAAEAHAHLATCAECRAALEAARAFDAALDITPPDALRRAAGGSGTSGGGKLVPLLPAVAVVTALAAALIVYLARPAPAPVVGGGPGVVEPEDTFRLKGGFDLELFADFRGTQRRLDDGDPIRPGEKVAFRVKARADGHLLILGVDARGETYPCYPQDDSGVARPWPKSAEPVALDQAIEFDDVPGEETLVALFCSTSVKYSEVAAALAAGAAGALPALHPDCKQRAVRLVKSRR